MIRPMGARALVKRLDAPKPESQHIIIPESVQDRLSQFGLVLAVGDLKQGGFDVGDMVILANYTGAPCTVEFDGDVIDAVMVGEEHVLAVVVEDPS